MAAGQEMELNCSSSLKSLFGFFIISLSLFVSFFNMDNTDARNRKRNETDVIKNLTEANS